MAQLKQFTLEEANALIPKLAKLMKELKAKRKSILQDELEIDALEIVTQKQDLETPPVLHEKIGAYNQCVSKFYGALESVNEMGCLLKDIDKGEVDFYANYRGRSVFLCWFYPEKEIAGWHEIGRDGSHRKPFVDQKEGD